MNKASGYITTVKGKISVSYDKAGDKVNFIVDIPEGETAEFECGEYKISLNGGMNNFSVN